MFSLCKYLNARFFKLVIGVFKYCGVTFACVNVTPQYLHMPVSVSQLHNYLHLFCFYDLISYIQQANYVFLRHVSTKLHLYKRLIHMNNPHSTCYHSTAACPINIPNYIRCMMCVQYCIIIIYVFLIITFYLYINFCVENTFNSFREMKRAFKSGNQKELKPIQIDLRRQIRDGKDTQRRKMKGELQ